MSPNWGTHMCVVLSEHTVAGVDAPIKIYKTLKK